MTLPERTRVGALALALLLVAAGVGVGGTIGVGAVAGQTAASGTNTHAWVGGPADGPVTVGSTAARLGTVGSTAVGPATAGPGLVANGSEAGPVTRCFTGEGYPISIGDGEGGATMKTVLHLSVLTDPAAGNEFGLETAGRLDGEPVVTLAAGVRLTAREALANGVDPFAAFDVLYTYDLRLPMFDGAVGDAGYEDDGSPIDSTAGAVAC
ncbi:hypothetical protein EKH57_03435 [Halorubrum sp. BOL3-1]|uniref:DUF7332 family protein n=1 Tax=Halorubrum sp. BOL3-1 TaxID=2497325 RepID=UPI001004EF22|nr:hypothetical protein [Halorubrum sp. BOL3-1]QAU11880.1 hypothetical protein EKH57_03435 [Halorubrum sp. BOL3-1]